MSNPLRQTIIAEVVELKSVTVEALDADIRASFDTVGVFVTVERAAQSYAIGADRFYRTILAAGAAQGVYSLDASDSGKFNSAHPIVKTLLGHVSDKTTSARKYASEVLNLAWKVTASGLNPFGFASVSDLRKAAKPPKEVSTEPEQDKTSTKATVAARVKAEAEAEATRAEAEAEAVKAEAKANVARLRTAQRIRALRAQVKSLQAAIAAAQQSTPAKAQTAKPRKTA